MAMTQREKAALDNHLTTEPTWRTDDDSEPREPLFVVTSVIGAVFPDDTSGLTPHEAAFVCIARADMPGDFEWTDHNGYHYRVSVARRDPVQSETTY